MCVWGGIVFCGHASRAGYKPLPLAESRDGAFERSLSVAVVARGSPEGQLSRSCHHLTDAMEIPLGCEGFLALASPAASAATGELDCTLLGKRVEGEVGRC